MGGLLDKLKCVISQSRYAISVLDLQNKNENFKKYNLIYFKVKNHAQVFFKKKGAKKRRNTLLNYTCAFSDI